PAADSYTLSLHDALPISLAEAIAGEWRAVPEKAEINVAHLPLTRLAATGLDRVTSQRKHVIDETAKYGASDLLCYRAADPESLVDRKSTRLNSSHVAISY